MAARKKSKAKSKAKAKPRAKSKSKSKRPTTGKKTAIKQPKRNTEAKAPLAEMDAAWQSLLETALERHRAENAGGAAGAKKSAKKK
jgi:hypothetical protein